jgi:SAM-dependent methyltransferase
MSSKKVVKKDWEKFYTKVGELNEKDLNEHKRVFREYFKTIKKYIDKKSEILEIACGPGKLLTILSKMIDNRIIATDIEDSMLRICKKNVKNWGNSKNIKFAKLDSLKILEYKRLKNKRFDIIIHHGFIEHLSNNDIVKILKLQLKKSEYIIFGLPYQTKKNQRIWDKAHSKIYRKKWNYNEWEKFLKNHFKLKEIFHFNVNSKTSCGDNLMCVISSKENQ